ncbi:hypothetical protein Tco_1575658 [Tanacetum coccineum]
MAWFTLLVKWLLAVVVPGGFAYINLIGLPDFRSRRPSYLFGIDTINEGIVQEVWSGQRSSEISVIEGLIRVSVVVQAGYSAEAAVFEELGAEALVAPEVVKEGGGGEWVATQEGGFGESCITFLLSFPPEPYLHPSPHIHSRGLSPAVLHMILGVQHIVPLS